MKKASIVVLVFLLALSMTGCQHSTGKKDVIVAAEDTALKNGGQVTLEIAFFSIDGTLQKMVSAFNKNNEDFKIVARDISEAGKLSQEDAIIKLNTEIISGKTPDMICFQHISPYPYIAKGLLIDISTHLDEMGLEADSIAAINAYRENGSMYYLSSGFTFETIMGKHSIFGDRYGWSLREYLDFERNNPEYSYIIYNITSENFLEEVLARYIRQAIDWENGSCNFDNDIFLEILEASKKINETPDTNNQVFGRASTLIRDNVLATGLSFVTSVDKLAEDERFAGCRLSYFGWPTVDGECGTDVHLVNPVGILKDTESLEGCMAFLNFMLTEYEDEFSMPMYMPRLMEELDEAKNRPQDENPITDEYAVRFLDLLSNIENIALYDPTVADIVKRETQAFLDDSKSAEDVLKLIESKVSLYVSEQS